MRSRRSRRLFTIAVLLLGVAAHRAEGAIEVTGLWYLAIGSQQGPFGLVQSDGTLRAAASFDFNSGSIDSTTGAFMLDIADVASLSCARLTGTVSADSRTLSGTATLFSTPPGCPSIGCFCSVETDVPLWGSRAPCGDGVVDPGEACDDGRLPPGDCCTLGCTLEPAGSPCPDDGNACTDDACDGSGACVHAANTAPCDSECAPDGVCAGGACVSAQPAPAGTDCESDGDACTVETCDGGGRCTSRGSRDCGPCAACEPTAGCTARIRTACTAGTGPARLDLRRAAGAGGDRAELSWSDPAPGDPSTFGDPTRNTEYAMCVFPPDPGATPLAALSIAAGGTCGGRPCWTASPDGFRRRDGRSGGGWNVTLRAGSTAGTSLDVRGAGSPLRLAPSLDASGVLVQVVARDGAAGDDLACWETTFTAPTQHDADRFSARR